MLFQLPLHLQHHRFITMHLVIAFHHKKMIEE